MKRNKFSNTYSILREFLNEDTFQFFKMSTLQAIKNELKYDGVTQDMLTFNEVSTNPNSEWVEYYVVVQLPEEIEVPPEMEAEFARQLARISEDAEH